MDILPAIDIIEGKCVRLRRGDYSKVTYYQDDPLTVAKNFEKDGAKWIHVVDLEGAKEGYPVNSQTILAIVKHVGISVQVGGGIRTIDDAENYLNNGVGRIVLGTNVINKPSIFGEIISKFGKMRVAVSMDVKGGYVAVNGWKEVSTISIEEFLNKLKEYTITSVRVTDIQRDGSLSGPNVGLIQQVINEGFEVVAAGGIASLDDLVQLKSIGASGAIIGKALYEGKINLKNALSVSQ